MALLLRCLQELRRKNGDENWLVHSAPPCLTMQATLFPELHENAPVELPATVPTWRRGQTSRAVASSIASSELAFV
jgi:hypothetical protein